MNSKEVMSADAIVIGGGIAGLQAALDLADQDYRVVVVEKDPSIGGKMIRLSKVFPTLDCASCITTPKMAAAAHHERITILTYSTLENLQRGSDGLLEAVVVKRARFVDEEKCIGCRQCEYQCPMLVPDEDQGGFSARKAIYIPFSNAVPQVALLDAENCMLCGKCAKVCPTQAIDYCQASEKVIIRAATAVVANGFQLISLADKPQYGCGMIPNVIDALQMERLLAPHGPYNRVLRPGDGMEPDSIAFVQCAGSRDRSMGVPYCSRVCCMYAIKQAMLLSGALPLADITIYYMDIRAFGKNYEQFFQNAQAMGVQFIKAKVASVSAGENGAVRLSYEDQLNGGATSAEHDLVVLSLGMVAESDLCGACPLEAAEDGFIRAVEPRLAPTLTSMAGVFAAGAAAGPKDIVDSIAEAGAAAMKASAYLASRQRREWRLQHPAQSIPTSPTGAQL